MKNKLTVLLSLIIIAVSVFVISQNLYETKVVLDYDFATTTKKIETSEEKNDDSNLEINTKNTDKKENVSFYENEEISFYYKTQDETCLSVFGNLINEDTRPEHYKGCAGQGAGVGSVEESSFFQQRLSNIMFIGVDVLSAKELGLEDTCYPYKTAMTPNGYNVFYFENADFENINEYDLNQVGDKCTYNPTKSEYGPVNLYLIVDSSGEKYTEISWMKGDTFGVWEIINSLKFK